MARLTVGVTEAVFSAKLNVSADLWASGRVKGKSQTAGEINRRLDEIRASALSNHRELSAVKEKVTAEDVKTLLLGMAFGQETLLAYFRTHNEKFDKRVGVNRREGTAKSYWGALKHVERFVAEKCHLSDIPFSALDRSFIDKYDLHLRVDCKLAPGTIVVQTVRLGTIINRAIADGIINADPFAGYEPESPERKPKFLTDKEVERLMTTPLTCPKHYLIRDLFLFSCWTGIPYGDMYALKKDYVSVAEDGEVWIKGRRGKTGIEYQVPLHDLPLEILERYRDTAPDGRLLPMYDNREINAQLKAIAKTCGINRRLTFHQGRHTFSTRALSLGVPIETVSRMMGHSQITTTQIYAKVTDNQVLLDRVGVDVVIHFGKFPLGRPADLRLFLLLETLELLDHQQLKTRTDPHSEMECNIFVRISSTIASGFGHYAYCPRIFHPLFRRQNEIITACQVFNCTEFGTIKNSFGKCKKAETAPCHGVAGTKKLKLPLATTWQTPKRPKNPLPERGKGQKAEFFPCHNVAGGPAKDFPFATAWQAPKSRIFPLPQRGRRPGERFPLCHNVAGAKKLKSPLATAWQTARRKISPLPQRGNE